MPSGPNNKYHLHIVIVPPKHDGEFIWVNICSIRSGIYYDTTCVLQKGCHEFIKHESYVAYYFASFNNINHIKKMIGLNDYISKPDISADILLKIQKGMEISSEIKRGVRRAFSEWRVL